MLRVLAILLFSALAAPAQSGLGAPLVGWLRDQGGSLRPVIGIRANFILGDSVLEDVHSAAFSGRSGLVKTGEEIIVMDQQARIVDRQPAPPGEALFAFAGDGLPALVFLPETRELYRQRRRGLAPVAWSPLQVDGEVRAIALVAGAYVWLVTEREGALWLTRVTARDGQVRFEAMLPGISAPVLLRPDGALIYADGDELVVRAFDATERRVPLPVRVTGFEQMGEGWIHILGGPGSSGLALRTTADGESLYHLPGGSQ